MWSCRWHDARVHAETPASLLRPHIALFAGHVQEDDFRFKAAPHVGRGDALGTKKQAGTVRLLTNPSFVSAGHVHEHDLRFKAAPRGGR